MSRCKTLQALKQLTLDKDQNFSFLANCFLDIVGDPALEETDLLTEEESFYQNLLKMVIKKHHGDDVTLNTLLLSQVKAFSFVHGMGQTSKGPAIVFYYFEDICMGLAIFSLPDGTTDFYRITTFVTETAPSEKSIISTVISNTYN